MNHIRNFSIIAHIDHGKSTLADRLIQRCGGLQEREMEAQVLDSMDIEKERGITIKAQTAALQYTARDGQVYNLNLIDTPGHVDFSYEVSRSLSACEGALLVVDASQGVEAQTVANCYTALDLGVEVVPVLNKMDLPNADPENARSEVEDVIGIDASDAIACSAKTGMGIDDILEAVVASLSPLGSRYFNVTLPISAKQPTARTATRMLTSRPPGRRDAPPMIACTTSATTAAPTQIAAKCGRTNPAPVIPSAATSK